VFSTSVPQLPEHQLFAYGTLNFCPTCESVSRYDPVHWGVPEGSYATDPNGPTRTTEFRTMVQALNRIGLRVVLDVVYNHIHGSGPSGIHSCLDKVVPGYYLRMDKDGAIENSTCMNNTASEHYMVDRLIVDDLKSWAVNYKVDGFRFDLMGHLMLQTMVLKI
jgi:pullulanase